MMKFGKAILLALAGGLVCSIAVKAERAPAASAVKPSESTTLTTGSLRAEPTDEQRMNDCMAIWDKGTHMTKAQWRRSCKTTLQSLTTE